MEEDVESIYNPQVKTEDIGFKTQLFMQTNISVQFLSMTSKFGIRKARKCIEVLEAMLIPYFNDEYKTERKKINNLGELYDAVPQLMEKKNMLLFKQLMKLMDKQNLLLQETVTAEV